MILPQHQTCSRTQCWLCRNCSTSSFTSVQWVHKGEKQVFERKHARPHNNTPFGCDTPSGEYRPTTSSSWHRTQNGGKGESSKDETQMCCRPLLFGKSSSSRTITLARNSSAAAFKRANPRLFPAPATHRQSSQQYRGKDRAPLRRKNADICNEE